MFSPHFATNISPLSSCAVSKNTKLKFTQSFVSFNRFFQHATSKPTPRTTLPRLPHHTAPPALGMPAHSHSSSCAKQRQRLARVKLKTHTHTHWRTWKKKQKKKSKQRGDVVGRVRKVNTINSTSGSAAKIDRFHHQLGLQHYEDRQEEPLHFADDHDNRTLDTLFCYRYGCIKFR